MIYPPGHSALNFSDDSLRLWTESSPREVRAYLYNCRQRGMNGPRCVIRVRGYMTTCYLKINNAAQFPCLSVESVEPVAG
jgi:hypothetical protein